MFLIKRSNALVDRMITDKALILAPIIASGHDFFFFLKNYQNDLPSLRNEIILLGLAS